MSASSNATSASLSRPTAAIIAFTVVAAAFGVYYINRLDWADDSKRSEAPGLHRSNAVRRSNRAPPAPAPDGEADREQPSIEQLNPQFGRTELSDSSDDEEPGHEHVMRPLGDGETVVDEESIWDVDEQNYGRRVGQNLVQLLFRISEDATKRNSYIHRGTLCNGCGAVPIRGVRYRCANCADFDLCEPCEQHQVHNKSHVFYKIRIPTSYFAPRQMQPAFYPGDPENAAKSLPKEFASRMAQDTGLDRPEIESYWEQWTFMANTEWREDPDGLCLAMDRETFDRCLVPSYGDRYAEPNLIHCRMFSFYDMNKDELISFPEFLHGLAYRKGKDKLKRIFDGYDLDEDGFIERKDFLKMFRAYYVLYKNMRVDMLEFMDEQAMNNTESQQLVSARAPVSAGFGRDGRFGNPAMPRAGEGKRRTPEGDLELTDQRGVSRPSGTDQRSRNDLFGVVLSGINPIYWQTVSNAPSTLATLQRDVLETIIARREQDQQQRQEQQPQHERSPRFSVFVNPELANELRGDGENRDQQWPPAFVTLSDVEHVCPGATFTTVPRGARAQVVEVAIERLNQTDRRNAANSGANNSVHERWRRRHFYTDEEEGAAAPLGWNPEDDLHWEADLTGANGDEAPRNPRHSRSSSRVRFAEDTDDFDTRSNASSRSIPERWGGMDIPDAEKDAGKDILFQVAQQSFNEMLDPLFLFKETQAVTAETSRKVRTQHRHLYHSRYFEQWAREVDHSLANSKTGERNDNAAKDIAKEIREWKEIPMMREVELEDVREQPLDRLLAFSGYSIEPEASSDNANASTNEEHGASSSSTSNLQPSTSSDSVSLSINGNNNLRDQTFPQFRPNSTAEVSTTNSLRPAPNETPNNVPLRRPLQPVDIYSPIREDNGNSTVSAVPYRPLPPPEPASEPKHEEDTPSPPPSVTNILQRLRQSILDDLTHTSDPFITPQFVKDLKNWDWMALYKLRELDLVETESKARHGWGKLSWEEFENVLLGKPGHEYGLGDEEFELGEEGRSGWETFADGEGEGEGERDVGVVRAKRRERRRGDLERLAEYVGSWVDLCIP